MTTLTLPTGVVVMVHDSPRKLPESRRTEHDYYALVESGVGSTQDDIDRHFEQMAILIGSGDDDAQVRAINNTRFLFANLLGKQYSARSLAFCCLVESFDSVAWDDYSPDGVERMSRVLSENGLTDEMLIRVWGDVKKNFTTA